MISKIGHLWDQLSRKDQRAIYLMAIILGPVLAVYLVVVPVGNYKQGLLSDLETKQELNQWLMTVGPTAKSIVRSRGDVSTIDETTDISSLVISVANKYQIELQKFEVDSGEGLRVWFSSIRYDRFVGFLSELSEKQGIIPKNLIIDAEKPGVVSVRGSLALQ